MKKPTNNLISRMLRFGRKLLTYAVLIGLIAVAFLMGSEFNPRTNTEVKEVEVIKEVKKIPPILKKIAKAESWDSHYCTDKLVKLGGCPKGAVGQVLVNQTRDIGRYAINLPINGKYCADKGYNVFNEEQNELCALELFWEYGSRPWEASRNNSNGWGEI